LLRQDSMGGGNPLHQLPTSDCDVRVGDIESETGLRREGGTERQGGAQEALRAKRTYAEKEVELLHHWLDAYADADVEATLTSMVN
jgi:hypothetical protein